VNTQKKYLLFNIIALVCAIWFVLTSWFWTYFAALIISYPVGMIGIIFWRLGKHTDKKLLNTITGWTFLAGLITSVAALVILIAMN
jgi:hypothetical protein